MLNGERHKRARQEGYEAGKAGKGKNPYSILGSVGQVYASLWDAGYSEGFGARSDMFKELINKTIQDKKRKFYKSK